MQTPRPFTRIGTRFARPKVRSLAAGFDRRPRSSGGHEGARFDLRGTIQFDVHVRVVAGHLPQYPVAGVTHGARQVVAIGRVQVDREARVMRRASTVDVIVGGGQPHVVAGPRRPDVGEIEDTQRIPRGQVHRHPQPADYCDPAKGGRV